MGGRSPCCSESTTTRGNPPYTRPTPAEDAPQPVTSNSDLLVLAVEEVRDSHNERSVVAHDDDRAGGQSWVEVGCGGERHP
jgi:hypothetical protein